MMKIPTKILKGIGNFENTFVFDTVIKCIGFSSDEEDDDFDDDFGSESSEDFGRKRGGPIRRSTRARTSRYDKDFSE